MIRPLLFLVTAAVLGAAATAGQNDAVDSDRDGVSDAVEARARGAGDGNFDAIADARQATVTSFEYDYSPIRGSAKQGTLANVELRSIEGFDAALSEFSQVAVLDWASFGVDPMGLAPLRLEVRARTRLVQIDYPYEDFSEGARFRWLAPARPGAQAQYWIEVPGSSERIGSKWLLMLQDNGPQDLDETPGVIRVVGYTQR